MFTVLKKSSSIFDTCGLRAVRAGSERIETMLLILDFPSIVWILGSWRPSECIIDSSWVPLIIFRLGREDHVTLDPQEPSKHITNPHHAYHLPSASMKKYVLFSSELAPNFFIGAAGPGCYPKLFCCSS